MDPDPSSTPMFIAQQRRLREPAQRHRAGPSAERHPTWRWVSPAERAIRVRTRQVVTAAREVVGALLRWVADLPYDSRERLRSKEQELATLGITWASDPIHDAALAREIEVARQRRRADGEVVPGGVAAARPDLPLQAAGGHRGNSICRGELNHAGTAVQV